MVGETLFQLGEVRFQTSVSPFWERISIEEPLLDLPRFQRSAEPHTETPALPSACSSVDVRLLSGTRSEAEAGTSVESETPVVVVTITDVHEAFFIYESHRRIVNEFAESDRQREALSAVSTSWAAVFGPSPRHYALRAFLGMASVPHASGQSDEPEDSLAIASIFGPPGDRDALIKYAEERLGITYTREQRHAIQTCRCSATLLSFFAGGGKSTIIEGMLLWGIRDQPRTDSENPPLFVVVSPSNTLADEWYESVSRSHGNRDHLSRVGFDAERNRDLFQDFRKRHLETALAEPRKLLKEVDAAIDILDQLHDKARWLEDPNGGAVSSFLPLLTYVHALRHEYLDQTYYQLADEAVREAVGMCRAIFVSGTQLLKLNGFQSEWSKDLKCHRRLVVFVDELHRYAYQSVAAMVAPFDAVFGVLDKWQARSNPHRPDFKDRDSIPMAHNTGNEPSIRALNWRSAAWWADRLDAAPVKTVTTYCCTEVFRYTGVISWLLRTLEPEKFNDMTCQRQDDGSVQTLFIPVVFAKLDDCKADIVGREEITRSRFVFAHLLVTLAMEVFVSCALCPGNPAFTIGIVAYYLGPIERLEEYFYYNLHVAVGRFHEKLGVKLPPEGISYYYFTNLCRRGVLGLYGPNRQAGVDKDVCFLLVLARQLRDLCWEGDLLEPSFRYMGFTRASKRCYFFGVDLSSGLSLPANAETLRKRAAAIGLQPRVHTDDEHRYSIYKKQLVWAHFMTLVPTILSDHLKVPSCPHSSKLDPTVKKGPPAHHKSAVFWDHIEASSPGVDVGRLKSACGEVYPPCCAAYDEMGGEDWGAPWDDKLASPAAEEQIESFWQDIDAWQNVVSRRKVDTALRSSVTNRMRAVIRGDPAGEEDEVSVSDLASLCNGCAYDPH